MNRKYPHIPKAGAPIAYVRPVRPEELPEEIRAQIKAGAIGALYAVHDENGERLALVNGRSLAFVLARQHDLSPVNVH